MIDLAAAQRAIYEAIRGAACAPCFVRLCMDHDALWVSDLPRRTERLNPALSALESLGLRCETDPATGLWRLDWTAEGWRERLDQLPDRPPALPYNEALHPAYALCRLLLFHPAPVERQPMAQVREVAKLAVGAPGVLLAAVPALAGEAARCLRMGTPLAEGAGRVLADWIARMDENYKREG